MTTTALRPLRLEHPNISRSYPYKWIADCYRLDYGKVLSYTDAMTAAGGEDADPEDPEWQRQHLTHWQRQAVAEIYALPPAVRVAFVEAVLDARQLWLRAQLHGMAAALAA